MKIGQIILTLTVFLDKKMKVNSTFVIKKVYKIHNKIISFKTLNYGKINLSILII